LLPLLAASFIYFSSPLPDAIEEHYDGNADDKIAAKHANETCITTLRRVTTAEQRNYTVISRVTDDEWAETVSEDTRRTREA